MPAYVDSFKVNGLRVTSDGLGIGTSLVYHMVREKGSLAWRCDKNKFKELKFYDKIIEHYNAIGLAKTGLFGTMMSDMLHRNEHLRSWRLLWFAYSTSMIWRGLIFEENTKSGHVRVKDDE